MSTPPPPPPGSGPFPPAPGAPQQPQQPWPTQPSFPQPPAPTGFPQPGYPQAPGYPPQPGSGAPPPYQQAPAGYTPYGGWSATGATERSKGLRTAMLVAFWLVTVMSAIVSIALFYRRGVWDDFRADPSFDSISKIDDADSAVGASLLLLWAAELFAVIMVALWAGRIARNAIARGATGISSGMAVGGWFIPIGCYWLGFTQLARSVRGVHGQAPSLRAWQISFIIAQIGSGVLFAIRKDITAFDDPEDVSAFLNRQGVVSLVSAALFLVATVFAMRATKQIDDTVSGG